MSSELSELFFKAANFLATPYELTFDGNPIQRWVASHWEYPIGFLIAYLLFCFFGIKLMKEKKPFDLRLLLAAWNALLSIFSFIGMCRTVPYLLGQLLSRSYQETVCTDPHVTYGNGPVGLWTALFILSKIPELIDTVFIVLRKRELIFLHWYHHVTVLLYCWHAYSTSAGSGLYFISMNYSVHALMYGYFCLQALKMVPKNFPAYLITIAQISQMFVGTGVCVSCWYFHVSNISCYNDYYNLIAGALMYGSYLYLFVEFAVKRFLFNEPEEGAAKKSAKKVA
jgi:hypothetical protein